MKKAELFPQERGAMLAVAIASFQALHPDTVEAGKIEANLGTSILMRWKNKVLPVVVAPASAEAGAMVLATSPGEASAEARATTTSAADWHAALTKIESETGTA
eukprot:11594008-Heterocapsa_arctica.AAC.1